MSVLNATQRAVIRADTGIDQLVIDRVCDAFDSLVLRDDLAGYQRYMETAIAQMGYEGKIPESERPTAVDIVKTICIHAYKDQWRCTYQQARARLMKMMEG